MWGFALWRIFEFTYDKKKEPPRISAAALIFEVFVVIWNHARFCTAPSLPLNKGALGAPAPVQQKYKKKFELSRRRIGRKIWILYDVTVTSCHHALRGYVNLKLLKIPENLAFYRSLC